MSESEMKEKIYVVGVDVGTTSIKCQIFDEKLSICAFTESEFQLEYPKPGYVELDPEVLWDVFVKTIKDTIAKCSIKPMQITALGLSVHRSSFITWNKSTYKPFHNFIMWNDLRADPDVKKWNNSFSLRSLRASSKVLHKITHQRRLLSASIYKLSNTMVLSRLYWVLQNNPEVKKNIEDDNVMFGTLDSWLIWRLSGRSMHVIEYSCASCTGIFDPYVMNWGNWCLKLFGIPQSILPKFVDSSGLICDTDPAIFGSSLKLRCVLGDQQASLFGQGCFDKGDVKLTLGTGTFLGVNTGKQPHASLNGLHPLVAWKIGSKTTFMVEGMCCDTASVINWGRKIGLYDDPVETAEIAHRTPDSKGVYFVPAFSGIQAPVNDPRAGAGFVGISHSTTKEHMVRAILDSVAFRAKQLYECILKEVEYDLSHIKIDGGVSNNEFIMQQLSDLTQTVLKKPVQKQSSCIGVAFLAGMSEGVWNDYGELDKLCRIEKTYLPMDTWSKQRNIFHNWERAIKRLGRWYKNGIR